MAGMRLVHPTEYADGFHTLCRREPDDGVGSDSNKLPRILIMLFKVYPAYLYNTSVRPDLIFGAATTVADPLRRIFSIVQRASARVVEYVVHILLFAVL